MVGTHTSPEDAIQLGRDLGCRTLMGMHWGSIKLTDEPVFEPPKRFREAGKAGGYAPEDLWIMKVGETREIPSRRGENQGADFRRARCVTPTRPCPRPSPAPAAIRRRWRSGRTCRWAW